MIIYSALDCPNLSRCSFIFRDPEIDAEDDYEPELRLQLETELNAATNEVEEEDDFDAFAQLRSTSFYCRPTSKSMLDLIECFT